MHAGQGLLILEAMKMENEIRAPHAGTITTLSVSRGQAVEKGQLLLVLDEVEAGRTGTPENHRTEHDDNQN